MSKRVGVEAIALNKKATQLEGELDDAMIKAHAGHTERTGPEIEELKNKIARTWADYRRQRDIDLA